MRIEAGPHRKHVLEFTLYTGFCVLGAGLFLYDGLVGYHKKNEPIKQLNIERLAEDPNYQAEPLPYSPEKITEQLYWSGGFGILGVITLVILIRARGKRLVLDDTGLQIDGRPVIPFDAMTGLKTDRWDAKGWVDLEYDSNGRSASTRLDSFKIDPCKPIIAAICDKKGFTNPITDDEAETPPPPATDTA